MNRTFLLKAILIVEASYYLWRGPMVKGVLK
jgi:hypothetical protein